MNDLGLRELHVDYVVVDTLRVPRATFATIIQAWRDGYTEALAEHSKLTIERGTCAIRSKLSARSWIRVSTRCGTSLSSAARKTAAEPAFPAKVELSSLSAEHRGVIEALHRCRGLVLATCVGCDLPWRRFIAIGQLPGGAMSKAGQLRFALTITGGSVSGGIFSHGRGSPRAASPSAMETL